MVRGTFANVRLRNLLVLGERGHVGRPLARRRGGDDLRGSRALPRRGRPRDRSRAGVRFGSSRDWAAKGPNLLGVRAVIAESYERIHRSNLIGMGIVPLQYPEGERGVARHHRARGVRGRGAGERRGQRARVTAAPDDDGRARRLHRARAPSRPRASATTCATAASCSTRSGRSPRVDVKVRRRRGRHPARRSYASRRQLANLTTSAASAASCSSSPPAETLDLDTALAESRCRPPSRRRLRPPGGRRRPGGRAARARGDGEGPVLPAQEVRVERRKEARRRQRQRGIDRRGSHARPSVTKWQAGPPARSSGTAGA